jgi:Ca2+-binding EF-hand superfamily protein
MRESFAVLDRNNTGAVTPADLTHQLNELGFDSSSAALSQYFPPGTSSINLSSYLHLLSSDLTRLTSSAELMDAFSTFDADDSGQIDVQELKDALLSTMPEPGEDQRRLSEREVDMVMEGFTGRRAFKRGAASNTAGLGSDGRKPVFRYGDFVKSMWGTGTESEKVEAV